MSRCWPGTGFPRRLGAWALAGGLAYVTRALVVAYRGFAHSTTGLIALILFGSWVLVMAVFMWRRASALTKETTMSPPLGAAAQTRMEADGPAAQ